MKNLVIDEYKLYLCNFIASICNFLASTILKEAPLPWMHTRRNASSELLLLLQHRIRRTLLDQTKEAPPSLASCGYTVANQTFWGSHLTGQGTKFIAFSHCMALSYGTRQQTASAHGSFVQVSIHITIMVQIIIKKKSWWSSRSDQMSIHVVQCSYFAHWPNQMVPRGHTSLVSCSSWPDAPAKPHNRYEGSS